MKKAILHDQYASEYDQQVNESNCFIAEALFGLCFEDVQPGQRLVDIGIGTGLCAALFQKAGLIVYGFDFSPVMLEVCAAKRVAADLQQHDLESIPWPYRSETFHLAVSCGVLHFIEQLEPILAEVSRILGKDGRFAFTTKVPPLTDSASKVTRQSVGDFEIYSHSTAYIQKILIKQQFVLKKSFRCLVGEEPFIIWVAKKKAQL